MRNKMVIAAVMLIVLFTVAIGVFGDGIFNSETDSSVPTEASEKDGKSEPEAEASDEDDEPETEETIPAMMAEDVYIVINDGDPTDDAELIEAVKRLHAGEAKPRLADLAAQNGSQGNLMPALGGVTAAADAKTLAIAALSNAEMAQNVVMGVKYRPTTESEFKTALEAVSKLDAAELAEETVNAIHTLASAKVWYGNVNGGVVTTRAVYDTNGNYHIGWKTDTKKDCKVLCVEVGNTTTVRFQTACGQLTVLKPSNKAPKQATKPAEQKPAEQKPAEQKPAEQKISSTTTIIVTDEVELKLEEGSSSGGGGSGGGGSSTATVKDANKGVQEISSGSGGSAKITDNENKGSGVQTTSSLRSSLSDTAAAHESQEAFVGEAQSLDDHSSGSSGGSGSSSSSSSSSGSGSSSSGSSTPTFNTSAAASGFVTDDGD